MKTIKILLMTAALFLCAACEKLGDVTGGGALTAVNLGGEVMPEDLDETYVFIQGLSYASSQTIALSQAPSFTQGSYQRKTITAGYITGLEPATTYYVKTFAQDKTGYELLSTNSGQFTTLRPAAECVELSFETYWHHSGGEAQVMNPVMNVNNTQWNQKIQRTLKRNGTAGDKLRLVAHFTFYNTAGQARTVSVEDTGFMGDNALYLNVPTRDDERQATVYVELFMPNALYGNVSGEPRWRKLCQSTPQNITPYY
jgi:hypothetical protein